MKKLPLTRGKYLLIDDDQLHLISKYKLFCRGSEKLPYAAFVIKKGNGKYVHRFIIKAKKGQIVDHINGNSLDCRKKNLRIVSHRKNILNSSLIKKRPVGIRGTEKTKSGKWSAVIRIGNHKKLRLGLFSTQKEASSAYEKAVKKYHEKIN